MLDGRPSKAMGLLAGAETNPVRLAKKLEPVKIARVIPRRSFAIDDHQVVALSGDIGHDLAPLRLVRRSRAA